MAITKANGSNYLSLASDTFYCRNRDFTVMVWCRPTEDPGSNGQYQSIIGCWDSGVTNGWSLAWNGALVFNFGWAVAGAYTSYPVTGTALAMSTWYHVAVSYNAAGGIWEQFVNGVQTRLVDETSTIPNATAVLRIGQDPDNPIGLAGQLAYVRIFEGYLSQAEVQAEMKSPIPVNRRFPCSLDIPLDNLGTPTVLGPDRSYTGHHAQSVTGTISWSMGPPAVTSFVEHPARRRRQELFRPSSGITVNVGQASETDTATTVGRSKARAVGQASETDSATAFSRSKARAVGLATETDTATAVARTKHRAVGQASETGIATATGRAKARTVGQPAEIDTATAVGRRKTLSVGIATETDIALPVALGGVGLGQAIETGTAQPVGRVKSIQVGQATESDTGLPVARIKLASVGQAAEVDTATALGRAKSRPSGQASETNTALLITVSGNVTVVIGQALETDTAQPAGRAKRRAIAIATEMATTQPVGRAKTKTVGAAVESDLAHPMTRAKARGVTTALELNAAPPVRAGRLVAIGTVAELDGSTLFGRLKALQIGRSSEVDTAQQVSVTGADQRDLMLTSGAAQAKWSAGTAGVKWTAGAAHVKWNSGRAGVE